MKVRIDQAYCIGSGLCQAIEPRVFAIGDEDGLARVRQGDEVLAPGPDNAAAVPVECEANVEDAVDSCPGGCIQLDS
jgi:ferredoxin